jgi:hypothetical protein
VLAVVGVLSLELVREERALLPLVPGDLRELLGARRGVDLEQEAAVAGGDRSQARRGYGRCGKTPWRAITKFRKSAGDMLLCGSDAPATVSSCGLMLTRFCVLFDW